MERPSKLEQVLEMSPEDRVALRKECHARVARASRNSDPPDIEDLLTLDWLDAAFEKGDFAIKETVHGQETEDQHPDQHPADCPASE